MLNRSNVGEPIRLHTLGDVRRNRFPTHEFAGGCSAALLVVLLIPACLLWQGCAPVDVGGDAAENFTVEFPETGEERIVITGPGSDRFVMFGEPGASSITGFEAISDEATLVVETDDQGRATTATLDDRWLLELTHNEDLTVDYTLSENGIVVLQRSGVELPEAESASAPSYAADPQRVGGHLPRR